MVPDLEVLPLGPAEPGLWGPWGLVPAMRERGRFPAQHSHHVKHSSVRALVSPGPG